MKVEFKLSIDGDVFFQVGEFAKREDIDEKQAIRWLITEGLKSFNGGKAHPEPTKIDYKKASELH